ncbi:MAG: Uma2 family endonuclease [Deltaproteobacteria bacterium]|nr:Uma2 family endonuclease [Deltaproteobacteria bacterium]
MLVRMAAPFGDDELFEFCRRNKGLRVERTPEGDLVIMPPAGGETGRRNSTVNLQLALWAQQDRTGISFDSSTGFILQNGAERSPDAAWVRKARWQALSPEDRERFPPLCPDFVIELRSPSDDLEELVAKMREYLDSGASLGLLLDPFERTVRVFRPGASPQKLDDPEEVHCDPELPGFVLDVRSIW